MEVTVSRDAFTVIESFCGAESPARAAVSLIAHVINNRFTVWPVLAGIEVIGERIGVLSWRYFIFGVDSPVGIDDGAHDALDLHFIGTFELDVLSSDPRCVFLVHCIDVCGQVERLFTLEHLCHVKLFAESDASACALRVIFVIEGNVRFD